MEEIIDELIRMGWERDGETRRETVRIPTHDAPLGNHGKSGGKITTFGGRIRLRKGHWIVTIGKRSTCFYSKDPPGGCVVQTNQPKVIFTIAKTLQ